MANYKEEIAKILEQYVQQVLVDGRSSAETYAAEILEYLSSMELPELPRISEQQIRDAIVKAQPDIQYDYESVADAQRVNDRDVLHPILAALKAENEELKKQLYVAKTLKEGLLRHCEYLQDECEKWESQLSTARADVAKEIQQKIEEVKNDHTDACIGITWHHLADILAPFLAPDKEGGK